MSAIETAVPREGHGFTTTQEAVMRTFSETTVGLNVYETTEDAFHGLRDISSGLLETAELSTRPFSGLKDTIDAFARLEGSVATVPNFVSVGGLALAADGIFNKGIATQHGLVEVATAFLLDNVDGYLARRLNQASELGAAVDALLDKLKQTLFIAALVKHKAIPLPAAAGIIGVNVANAIATNQFETNKPGQQFVPSIYGKMGAFVTNSALMAYASSIQDITPNKRRTLRTVGNIGVMTGVGLCANASIGYFKRAAIC